MGEIESAGRYPPACGHPGTTCEQVPSRPADAHHLGVTGTGARRDQSPVTRRFKSRSSIGNDAVDVPDVPDLADADSRTTISRASWAAPVTGPPANTGSPAESALAEAREPSSRTTDALVSIHVHVVLSAAR